MEREKARQRAIDTAEKREARAGHVTGGRVFDSQLRGHRCGGRGRVQRDRRARRGGGPSDFQLSADGYGTKAIAKP
jgi:hypothetical protein